MPKEQKPTPNFQTVEAYLDLNDPRVICCEGCGIYFLHPPRAREAKYHDSACRMRAYRRQRT